VTPTIYKRGAFLTGGSMGRILLIVFELLAVTGILLIAYKAWRKAEITSKLDKINELEEDFKVVKEFEKGHKNLSEKVKTVNRFKKQDF
jgi:hypothetical protein